MLSRVSLRANTTWWLLLTFVLLHCSHVAVNAWDTKYVWVENEGKVDNIRPEFILKEHGRYRRDLAASPTAVPTPTLNVTSDNGTSTEKSTTLPSTTNVTPSLVPTPSNTDNKTVTNTANATVSNTNATVVKKPLLGENGTGIYHGKGNIAPKEVASNATAQNTTASNNYTNNTPKVSNPILPYDDTDLSSVFSETPETIQAKENITNLKYDNHTYYNSIFINNITYFNEHWNNITNVQLETHPVLSNSHRHATTLKLNFDFPFYGFPLREITVATGGFIYTGEHMHNWLAATQYIAPLMANFDTKIGNFSYVKLYDDGEKFTALWERVYLKEHTNDTDNKEFTFACTLYKNGDIVFAYKDVPIPISNISDKLHPVKVGISDAYITDTILFYVRRKSIYEYHRVLFNKDHPITSGTVLKLIALPTCIQQNSCETCLNNNSSFTCFWCEQMQKCSSGTDRGKQDWQLRHCDKTQISSESQCPAQFNHTVVDNSTAYVTDTHTSDDHVFKIHSQVPTSVEGGSAGGGGGAAAPIAGKHAAGARGSSSVGGAVTAFVVLALVCTLAAWLLYAFKNPHTRSGQLLIKYRPSQWSWRRGEARYTAATIHM